MIEINVVLAILTFCVTLFAQVYATRKHLSGALDPLAYFIVTTSFAITLASTLVNDVLILARIVFYLSCFWVGFFIASPPAQRSSFIGGEYVVRKDASFSVSITMGLLLFVVANSIVWQRSGVPIFSVDPSLQKSESFTDGLGIVRRLNWGLGVFLFMGSVFWALFNRSKVAILYLTILSVITALNGSKSALLPVVFALGLYLRFPFLNDQSCSIHNKVRGLSRYALAVAAIPVLVVFLIESDGVADAVLALGTRLLYFGDVLLYWGDADLRQHFKYLYSPCDYPLHLFGGVLGAIRLVSYSPPIGNDFVQYSLGVGQELSTSLGPNVPFYVKGELFFGVALAAVYSVIVGVGVAFFRGLFTRRRPFTLTSYTVFATLTSVSMTLPVEDALMIGRLFDLAIFLVPVLLLSRVFVWSARSGTPTKNIYA